VTDPDGVRVRRAFYPDAGEALQAAVNSAGTRVCGAEDMMPVGSDPLIGRTVEAVAFTWEGAAMRGLSCPAGLFRRRIEALSAGGPACWGHQRGEHWTRRGAVAVAAAGPLPRQRAGCPSDKPDSIRAILRVLARRGVGPGLVLVVVISSARSVASPGRGPSSPGPCQRAGRYRGHAGCQIPCGCPRGVWRLSDRCPDSAAGPVGCHSWRGG
jgi:hypothetical protein